MYDVAVVGGGPAGSHVAYRLASMGHSVVVLERKKKLGEPVCCTGIISRECVSSFAIDESVIFRWVNGAKVFSPAGKLLKLWREQPQACIVDRAALNMALASRARSKGAEYALNSQVRVVKVEADLVKIEANGHETGSRSFQARAVVIAAGFGSKIIEGLGLGRAGDFVAGAQAEVTTVGVDEVEVYLGDQVAPGFFAWLVPTLPHRGLVGLLSRRQPGFYLQKLLASLAAQGKIASAEVDLSYGGITLRPLARTYGNRLLVVGTAAGQVKPITGGGVYYGLLCADMAANNLHQALERDDLSGKSLAKYEREWKRKLGRELRLGYWARKFYELLGERQVEQLFDIITGNNIDKALLEAEDLSFDWHGQVVLKLMAHQAFSKVFTTMKLPMRLRVKR